MLVLGRPLLALSLAVLAFLASGCRGTARDGSGLGPAYAQYVTARDASPANDDLTLRRFYDAFVEALRSKDPRKAQRFYRPDAHPEARNAIRMGLQFITLLEGLETELLGVRDLGGRALLEVRETATFKFRDRPSTDKKERQYQLVRLGREWYIEPPDLGPARKRG